MKKFALFVGLLVIMVPASTLGQGTEKPYLTYKSERMKYLVAKKTDKIVSEFHKLTTSDATWSVGNMAVGTVNNTTSPPCPLNTSTNIKILWPSSREMLLRKEISLDPGARDVRVFLTLDNGAQVFWNGNDISGGIRILNGCATESNISFLVNPSYLTSPIKTDANGKPVHLLAVRGNWQSSKNYIDVKVTGKLPYTITALADPTGSITPTTAAAFAGETVTFTATANPGFHVASFKVDGATKVTYDQPTSAPTSATYTLTVTGNNSVVASFAPNYYWLTTAAGLTGGEVFVENASTAPLLDASNRPNYINGTTLKVRAAAPQGYYISGWTINGVASTGGGNPLAVTMGTDKTITANYSHLPTDPSVYPVTVPGDYPNTDPRYTGTLRWAVDQADNVTAGLDIVKFTFPGTFELKSPLPAFDQLVYDGTAAGGTVVIKPAGEFGPSTTAPDGLILSGVFFQWGYTPEGSTVKGVTITGFPGAGVCMGSNGNSVENCVITENEGDGICIIGGSGNTIGGTEAGMGNRIFANVGNGISVKRSAVVNGVIPAPPSKNTIVGNSIYGNGQLGIDLIGIRTVAPYADVNGVTWNRFPDGVEGNWSDYVNNGQNFPDLYFASAVPDDPSVPQESFVLGKLYGPPGKQYRIEIFENTSTDASGNGEGETLIGTSDDAPGTISEGPAGFYTLEIPLRNVLRGGEVLSASATDELGNSSEFSTVIYAGVVTRKYGPMEAANPANGTKYRENTSWVVNTTFSGIPLHWPDGKGEFAVGSSFDTEAALPFKNGVAGAFASWNGKNSTNEVPLRYAQETGGLATDHWGGEPDGRNTLVFAKDAGSWAAKTKLTATNILALTRVRYKVSNGEITDADIAFNAEHFDFKTYSAASPPDSSDAGKNDADFEAVLTHEIGHWGGLADFYNPGDPFYNLFMGPVPLVRNPTMYGIVHPEDIFHRDIYLDDIAGMQFIYGEAPSGRADIVLLYDGSSFFVDPTVVNGFSPAKNVAYELIDKMRDGDRIAVAKLNGTTQLPLTALTSTNRGDLKTTIGQFLVPDGADKRPIGSGLVYAKSLFTSTNAGAKGIILFSAGNETESPSALSQDVLNNLAGIPVYTMGFSQSALGQTLGGSLANATRGAYYTAADSTISEVVNQIWFNQVGLQLSGSTVFPSDAAISWQGGSTQKAISYQGSATWKAISWQGGSTQKAISFQGKVDNGATSLQPAISWQGTKTAVAKVAGPGDLPKFHLALVPPGVVWPDSWDYETQGDPPGTITPTNYDVNFKGVKYVTGPTYAFYVISEEFESKKDGTWIEGKKDGTWTLVPAGANGETAAIPQYPIPVVTSLASNTDVIMDVAFDKSTYSLNDVVTLRVTLTEGGQVQALHTAGGGPISGATVTTTINIPGNALPYNVTLTESGTGIYSGKFANTSVGGTYDVTILADGIAPVLNSPFERKWEESFYVVPPYARTVLFADNSVNIGNYSRITSGDVVVNRDAPTGASGFELTVHVGASTPGGYNLKADRIWIDAGATVLSDLYYNELSSGAGPLAGELNTPLSLPVGEFPTFETTDQGVTTATNISVGSGNDGGTRAPGIYGALTLEPGSKLKLTAGTYNFRSIRMKTKSKLILSGDAKIRVLKGIHADNEAYVGLEGSMAPTGTVFFVESANSQSITSVAVNFSPKSIINATIFAKNGTILLNQESRATGSFLAKDVSIGQGVSLSLASAFVPLLRPAGAVEGQTAEGTRAAQEIPETYSLSQNYPNPFNPSTTISYALPEQARVSLIIYDALGREVSRLVDNVEAEGYHTVQWTGVNFAGSQVSTGVYFYRLQAGDFSQIRKMVLVK